MSTKKYISAAIALAMAASLASAITVFAANQPNGVWGHMRGSGMKPAVFGTVSAINGNTLTVNGRQGSPGMNGSVTGTTAFTIDASNATVVKNNVTSTISAILVGDTVSVQGTVNGTNITATMIRDGMMRGGSGGMGNFDKTKRPGGMPTSTPIQGDGQPVVAGTISVINGSTLSLTNKSNVAYTIDASNAKILEGQNTVSLSNLSVGDSVIVQGTVNGTSVTASTVIDQTRSASATTNQPATPAQQPNHGFFGGIINFFKSLFGF